MTDAPAHSKRRRFGRSGKSRIDTSDHDEEERERRQEPSEAT